MTFQKESVPQPWGGTNPVPRVYAEAPAYTWPTVTVRLESDQRPQLTFKFSKKMADAPDCLQSQIARSGGRLTDFIHRFIPRAPIRQR
jgi:hypothetical protein